MQLQITNICLAHYLWKIAVECIKSQTLWWNKVKGSMSIWSKNIRKPQTRPRRTRLHTVTVRLRRETPFCLRTYPYHAIKVGTKGINHNWVDNNACSLQHNVNVVTYRKNDHMRDFIGIKYICSRCGSIRFDKPPILWMIRANILDYTLYLVNDTWPESNTGTVGIDQLRLSVHRDTSGTHTVCVLLVNHIYWAICSSRPFWIYTLNKWLFYDLYWIGTYLIMSFFKHSVKRHARPTKTQISPHIHAICSESLLSAWENFAFLAIENSSSEDSDQNLCLAHSRPRWLRRYTSNWWSGGRVFNPCRVRQHSSVEFDHELFSTDIPSLPPIQEGL